MNQSLFLKEGAQKAAEFDWKNFEDEFIRRQFMKIAEVTIARLSEDKIARVSRSLLFFIPTSANCSAGAQMLSVIVIAIVSSPNSM